MRIKNFILYGPGRGLKPFFWVSFLFAALVGLFMYFMVSGFAKMPEVQHFVNALPTITLDEGKITSPQKTFTQVPLPFLTHSYFILNTLDNPDFTLNFDVGVYLTKEMVYIKNFDYVRVEKLSTFFGNGVHVLSPDVITKTLQFSAIMLGVLYFALLFFILWVTWVVINLCSALVLRLCGKFVCPQVRARAVSVVLISLSVAQFILLIFYVPLNLLYFIIFGILLSVVVLWQTPLHSQVMEENLVALKKTQEPQTTVIPAPKAKRVTRPVRRTQKQPVKKTTKPTQQKKSVKTTKTGGSQRK